MTDRFPICLPFTLKQEMVADDQHWALRSA
jgi:hypothetical protein